MYKKSKKIMVLTVVAVFGIATLAFAGWEIGYGPMMGYGGKRYPKTSLQPCP